MLPLDVNAEANQKFLDRAIARGATVFLAADPTKIETGTVLYKEVQYLLSKGYELVKGGDGVWKFVPK